MTTFEEYEEEEEEEEEESLLFADLQYLIVRADGGGIRDMFNLITASPSSLLSSGLKFLVTGDPVGVGPSARAASILTDPDHRWVIIVSLIVRKIIAVLGKPMEWTGYVVEFILNLLSHNGRLLGLIFNLLTGKVVIPHRGSDTYISAIGHLDGRVDLYNGNVLTAINATEEHSSIPFEDRALLDFCIMSSKLAYENAKVIKNIVVHHWKMHFVEFLDGWNEFQKEKSTQVFILCDKPKDARLILIGFRGTEPFDADDWITDFDYSWYEIPKLGKVHMGFLEALGLGNRSDVTTFQNHLQTGSHNLMTHTYAVTGDSTDKQELVPVMGEISAYYGVKSKLKELLDEHKNAKFIVTGHSLGGALAILFPTVLLLHEENEMIQRLLGVYTFGQPRVGDRKLGRFMKAHLDRPSHRYFRVVYCNDLVPRLPYDNKTFLFKHFGKCMYYNSIYVEQEVNEEPNKNYFGMAYLIPEYLNAIWELIRSLIMPYLYGKDYKEGWFRFLLRVQGLAIPGISAHCPTDYVNSVRLGSKKTPMSSI